MPIIKLASGENIDSISSRFLRSLYNYKKRNPNVTRIGFKVMFFNLDDWGALNKPTIDDDVQSVGSSTQPGVERSIKRTYEKRHKMNRNRTVVAETKLIKEERFEEKVQIFETTHVLERVLEHCDIKDIRQVDLEDPIGGHFQTASNISLDTSIVQKSVQSMMDQFSIYTNSVMGKIDELNTKLSSITSQTLKVIEEKKAREKLVNEYEKQTKELKLKIEKLEEENIKLEGKNKGLTNEYREAMRRRLDDIKSKEDIDLNKILLTRLWNQPENVSESLIKIKLIVTIFKNDKKTLPERMILELIKEIDVIGQNCRNKALRTLIGQFWQFVVTMTDICYSM